jgi:hypothetical protein
MFRPVATTLCLCLAGLSPALAQGSGVGPDNGADPQSMSAASAAAAQHQARPVMSGNQGMSHATARRIERHHRKVQSHRPN